MPFKKYIIILLVFGVTLIAAKCGFSEGDSDLGPKQKEEFQYSATQAVEIFTASSQASVTKDTSSKQPDKGASEADSVLTAAQEEPIKPDETKSEAKKEPAKIPIVVNADKIEYSQDKTSVTASGNVEVIKDNTVLTCDKVSVNTQTNDVHAEGNVRLKEKDGVITAKSFDYNFKTKTGQGYDGKIEYPPYYGRGAIIRKVSENEIDLRSGYITTCDREHPHYRIQTRLAEIFPKDRVTTKGMTFRVNNTPILYMPKFTQNLKDDRMHVQVTPGKDKNWGLFLLTAWRYDLTPYSGGRIHFDLRERRGIAWGVDNYYDTKKYGLGYFKFYYMNEKTYWFKRFYNQLYKKKNKGTTERERYRIQWRHKWDIDKDTYIIAQYNKLRDSDFLRDYFLKEFEKDMQPVSYMLFSHNMLDQSATFSILTQKRTSRIFSETEMLPQMEFDVPNIKIFETPFYISNNSSYTNFNKKQPAPTDYRLSSQRYDNYNALSMPFKLGFLDINPYAGSRETYYKRIVGRDEGLIRETWDSGVNVSTRLYRIYNIDTNILGIKFQKLRHIISPNVTYAYTHSPTASPAKIIQFDSIDSLSESNQANISLENKLQTKRSDKTVDFLRFIASSSYLFNIEGRKRHWDDLITFDLEVLPFDWMLFDSDATYDRKNRYFTLANFDLKSSGKNISWGAGYRYERKSSAQVTGEVIFNLIKGLSFSIYERFQFHGDTLLKEQTYRISKELHCWILDINYNVVRGRGETIWFALRLKAFPEMSIDYNQNYNAPKPGSQGYRPGEGPLVN